MMLDRAVCRRKFAHEVEVAQRQADILRAWGCWITGTSFPHVDVVFVPQRHLRMTVPVQQEQRSQLIVLPPGVQAPAAVAVLDIPVLAARAFGVRITMDDFDQRPPSVVFVDAWTRAPLRFDQLFRANHVDNGRPFAVLLADHPTTHLPFLCMRGVREYHEHPQHTGDDWMLYRGALGLFSLLATIYRTCVELAQPNLVLAGPSVQVRWEANV